MDSAIETRDVLSKLDGVVRVHTYMGKARVMLAGGKELAEETIAKVLGKSKKKLALEKLTKVARPAPKPAPKPDQGGEKRDY